MKGEDMITEKEMEILERAVKVSAYSDEDALLILKGLVISKNEEIESLTCDRQELKEEVSYVSKENAHLIGMIKERDEALDFAKKVIKEYEEVRDAAD